MIDILAISGKLKMGKDTCSNFIIEELKNRNFSREIYKTSFASVIKDAMLHIFPQINRDVFYGPSELRSTKIENYINPETGKTLIARDPLTQIGKLIRSYNPDAFVLATTYNFPQLIKEGKFIIVTDCRFTNEANHLKKMGARIVRIIRPDIENISTDISETNLDSYADFDKIVINNTIEDLRKATINIINEYIL